jgi:hypothetical protein
MNAVSAPLMLEVLRVTGASSARTGLTASNKATTAAAATRAASLHDPLIDEDSQTGAARIKVPGIEASSGVSERKSALH